ncbi:AAA family ATPase [Acrocarpospora sp. B8E8]|uniref:AAA family ATPase n=1 Tax=Acrocarpospora sp. B8E8 TaxID=3153572 RepID=UPI00325EFA9C
MAGEPFAWLRTADIAAEVFEEARAEALKSMLGEAERLGVQPNENNLKRKAASFRADQISQFDQFRQAAVRTPKNGPQLRLLRLADLTACLLVAGLTFLLHGWTIARQGPVGSYPDVGPLSLEAVLAALPALGLLLISTTGIFFLAWLLAPRGAGDGSPPAGAYVAAAAVIALATTVRLGYLAIGAIGVWGALGALLAGSVWGVWFTAPVKCWWLALARPRAAAREREQAQIARQEWVKKMKDLLTQRLRQEVMKEAARSYSMKLSVDGTDSLRRARGKGHVETPAERALATVSAGMHDGSVALSGPRGVGKTEILTAFCRDPGRLGLVVVAPTHYERRDFALHLFAEVCKWVLEDGPRQLRRQADQHLRQIWHLQTRTAEASLVIPVVGLSFTRGRSRARQPLTYPEIVHELRRFLEFLAGIGQAIGKRLVIGIDELDRIQPPTAAQDFLNEIKVIFDVPGCLFVLSVSDEALRAADLLPVGGRDVFDSAIDEVIRVEPLCHEDAALLLDSRVIDVPVVFIGLFNALAGGIPRDLLRIARAAILSPKRPPEEEVATTAKRLVERELARIANCSDSSVPPELLGLFPGEEIAKHGTLRELGEQAGALPPGDGIAITIANRLLFLDTVLGMFSADLTTERIKRIEADKGFTALARAASIIGTADHQANAALRRIRTAWLDELPPLAR